MPVAVGRRKFKFTLGGAAACSLAARAQQGGKLPTIGVLGANTPPIEPTAAALVQRLRKLGWIGNRTIGDRGR